MAPKVIPDLIITDVIMPGLSGYELCRRLKNQMITSHIPVLILSAKTSVENQIEGLEMGADIYIIKPFNLDHLKAQILRLISFKEAIYSRYIKETALIPSEALATKLDEEFMQKVMIFIEENLTNSDLSVDQYDDSTWYLNTTFKSDTYSGLEINNPGKVIVMLGYDQWTEHKHMNSDSIFL